MDAVRARELWTAGILFLTFGTAMLDRMTQIFLGPYLVRDFHLTNMEVGLLAACCSIGWATSAFFFGFVSDRVGRKVVLIPAVVIFSLMSALSGFARTFEELLVIRILLGIAEGPCWSVILALMEASSAPERRGGNLGIVNSAGTLVGCAIAPIFATQVAAMFGWREAFLAAAIPGTGCALLIALLVPEPERPPSEPRQSRSDIASVLVRRDVWLCFVGAFLIASWLFGFSVFAPLYMTRYLGMPETMSGLLMGISGLGGFFASLFWPHLSDRIGRRRPVLICASALTAALPLAFLLPLFGGSSLSYGLTALIFTAGPAVAVLVLVIIPVELVPRRMAATAIGFVAFGGDLFGATLAPIFGGYLADRFTLAAPLVMASVCAAMIVVVGIVVRETGTGGCAAPARQRQVN